MHAPWLLLVAVMKWSCGMVMTATANRLVVRGAGMARPLSGTAWRGQDEPAGLDALGADQVVGQVADLAGGPAEQDHFQAALLVEMDVGRGDDPVEMVVLQIGQPRAIRETWWS